MGGSDKYPYLTWLQLHWCRLGIEHLARAALFLPVWLLPTASLAVAYLLAANGMRECRLIDGVAWR